MEHYELARAKINLTLHITGQRDDGYHLLDSLVMFADVGDRLSMWADEPIGLKVEGPEAAGVPHDGSNSVLTMARAVMRGKYSARFVLGKHLPSAAGIGGGTADAAAAFRLICKVWPDASPTGVAFDQDESDSTVRSALCNWAKQFGADVPVCLFSRTARMRGIGEDVIPFPNLPRLHTLLVNPRVSVATPQIFKQITTKTNAPMTGLRDFDDARAFIDWLETQRNDMQDAALATAPVIQDVLDQLARQSGCALARMSGSGATCFGLFLSHDDALAARRAIQQSHPNWWAEPCILGDERP